jgi:hypothetical protein
MGKPAKKSSVAEPMIFRYSLKALGFAQISLSASQINMGDREKGHGTLMVGFCPESGGSYAINVPGSRKTVKIAIYFVIVPSSLALLVMTSWFGNMIFNFSNILSYNLLYPLVASQFHESTLLSALAHRGEPHITRSNLFE